MIARNQIILEYILIRFFSEKATSEEETFVRQWISQCPKNSLYYHKIQRLWLHRIIL